LTHTVDQKITSLRRQWWQW